MDSPVTERLVGLPNMMGPADSDFRQFMEDSQGPQPLTNIFFNSPTTMPPSDPFSFGARDTSVTNSTVSGDSIDGTLDDMLSFELRPTSPLLAGPGRLSPLPDTVAGLTEMSEMIMQPQVPAMTRSRKRKMEIRKPPPLAATNSKPDGDLKPAAKSPKNLEEDNDDGNCIICLCDPDPQDLAKISGCNHQFCFDCIEQWSERENTCPLCKNRFTKIERVNKLKRQKTEQVKKKNSKRVKNRDQRTDLQTSVALEGLLAGLGGANNLISSQFARLIFSGHGGPGGNLQRDGPRRQVSVRLQTGEFSFLEDTVNQNHGGHRATINRIRSVRRRHGGTRRNNESGSGAAASLQRGPQQPRVSLGISRLHAPIYGAYPAAVPAVPSRSHAVNAHDESAGNTPQNALEIADDSDDDDVVEVVDARGRAV